MRYYNSNFSNNSNIIEKLSKKIIDGITSALLDYPFLYSEEELRMLIENREKLEKIDDISMISNIEDTLKPLIFRTWMFENENGSNYIHWIKDENFNRTSEVISTTFGDTDSFCDSKLGIQYKVNLDAFVAACEKDAATIMEDSDKMSGYTIKELPNNKIINSYNLATPIITPKQVFEFENNEYKSKHNEIILDTKYAIPIGIVCLNDIYLDVANTISDEYDIPIIDNKMSKHI